MSPSYFDVASTADVIERVYGNREEWFRYELLNHKLEVIGHLDGALTGGQLEFGVYKDIRGSGTLVTVMYDENYTGEKAYPDEIDWMNTLVRITYETPEFEEPLITAIPEAPDEQHDDPLVTVELELYDRTLKLQQDNFGYVYTVPAGVNILAKVKEIALSAGFLETEFIADESSAVLANAITWTDTASKYRIINDLLDVANFFSIYADGMGRLRCEAYIPPSQRPVDWDFQYGEHTGLYLPKFKYSLDRFGVPNKLTGVAKMPDGETSTVPVWATATDTRDTSPFSYQNRGSRWITADTITDIDLPTGTAEEQQAYLQAIVDKKLEDKQAVSATLEGLKHPWLPIRLNSMVTFENRRFDQLRAVLQNQSVNLYAGGLFTSRLRRVA